MPRFDFQSPGAAFVDTLTRVLAERKAEERQQMLDRLTQAAEERANRESLDRKAYQDAQVKNMQHNQTLADAAESRAKEQHGMSMDANRLAFLERGMEPDTPFFGVEKSPEDLALLQRAGVLKAMPPPPDAPNVDNTLPGTRISAQPTSYQYIGSPEHRAKTRERNERGAAIAKLLQNPEVAGSIGSGPGAMLSSIVESGGDPTSAMTQLIPHTMPGQEAMVFDEASGKFNKGPMVKPGQTIIQRSRPPQQPASATRNDLIGWNNEGNPMFQRPDNSIYTDTSVKGGNRDMTDDPIRIPEQTKTAHRRLFAMVQPRETGMWGFRRMSPPEQTDIDMFKQAAITLIESADRVPSKVRQAAIDFVQTGDLSRASNWMAQQRFTDNEVALTNRLINIALPPDWETILNPPKQDNK